MKRILFLFILWMLLPIPSHFEGIKGYISYQSGIYWCTDEFSCRHEEGHLIDMQNGWISETDEYQIALLVHVTTEIETKGIGLGSPAQQIVVNLIQEPREVYADVYAIYDGDVPDCLKEFYPEIRTRQYSSGLALGKGKVFIPVPLEWGTQ